MKEWPRDAMMGRLGDEPTILTVVAKGMVTIGNVLLFLPSGLLISLPLLLILNMVKRFIPGGMLLLVPFSLLWTVILGGLIGTSWLWEKVPPLRLALLTIGVPLAWLGTILVQSVPDDPGDRWSKAALADQWPLTYDLIRQLREG